MITRSEAIDALCEMENSGILDKGLEKSLHEISICIELEEKLGIHAWGAPNSEIGKLFIAYRTDLPEFDAKMQEQKQIIEKYSFENEK